MAKGHRGKPQTAEATNGPAKAKTNNKAADKENSTDTQNLQMSKGRNRRGDKPKLINEEQKPEAVEENSVSLNSNHVSEKKEPGPGVHSKVQPTTEQLMIAKIIDHSASDDPHQRKKIQQVMDVTGKPEDEVATALFDAGWDESRAVELLLEDGDHLSAWEETGKKKKSKKTAVEDNDGWGDDGGNDAGGNGGFQDPRDKRQRGPPRMQRRGRGDSQAKGDRGGDRDRSYAENGDQVVPSGGRGGRRGDQPPRRGGRGGGTGGRAFSSRTQQSNGGSGPGGSSSGPDPVGFQGSIDTWANPNDQKSSSTENSNNSRGGDRSSREVGGSAPGGEGGGGPGGPRGERPLRGGGRSGRGGGQSGKDAFDNAGNWGDDFPQADDWDNEEYTGSLADTKVFTASGDRGTGQKQRTPPTRPDQQQQQPQQPQQSLPAAASVANPPQPQQQQQPPGPVGANSQRGYSAAALAASNGPSVTSTYPQSIDLSTLLQKPTTQSSVGSSAAPGAQFNQQATETLKAVVGIGQTSSNTSAAPGSQVAQQQPNPQQDNSSALYSYAAQASAFSSIKSQSQGRQPPQSKGQGQAPGGGRTGSRMQPPSSSKAPAVEMPGDSLGRLDVQFGGLDLQFGGSGSANSDAMTGSSGFEFGSASTGNQQVDPNDQQKTSSGVSVGSLSGGITKPVTDSFAPTAKEVNKSLSNALSSSGKLNPSAGSTLAAAPVANPTNQQDSFSKSSSSGTAPTANNSSGHVPNLNSHATNVAPGGGSGSGSGGNNFNKNPGQSDNQGLSGYSTYNNYNKQASGGGYGNSYQQYQQYPNSNSFSSQQQQQQQQGSAGQSAGSSSQYKGVGQYDKYDPSLSNPAAAVLGLANTNTTNALSGKVSATTASKVNMPNLPPGVASMLHPQYVAAAGLAPAAAFYGLQQPMYGAYGNTGLEDLAAMQRASASAAGLHTLPTTGYYDPNNQFAATSLGAAVANRDAGQNSNIASQLAGLVSSASSATGGNGNSSAVNTLGSTSGFGSTSGATSSAAVAAAAASAAAASTALAVNNAADSTSSPGPATSTGSSIGQTGSSSVGQHHSVQQQAQQQQQQQQQQQTAFNLAATNAFAAQQMPPGYAYYFGNMGNMSLQGYPQTPQGHVYQPQAMTVPGAGTTPSQFQKQTYGTSYGSGYDTLGQQQQGNAKDFSSNYSSNGQSKSTGGSAAAGTGAHQYWGNTLTSTQLW